MHVCVCCGFNLDFGLLASRARSRLSRGTDHCGSGGPRVPAAPFMEHDLLVAGDNDPYNSSVIGYSPAAAYDLILQYEYISFLRGRLFNTSVRVYLVFTG